MPDHDNHDEHLRAYIEMSKQFDPLTPAQRAAWEQRVQMHRDLQQQRDLIRESYLSTEPLNSFEDGRRAGYDSGLEDGRVQGWNRGIAIGVILGAVASCISWLLFY